MATPPPHYRIRMVLIMVGITGILLLHHSYGLSNNTAIPGIILLIVQLTLIDMMLRESNLMRTVYYRYLNISIAFFLVGALLKISHYNGGDQLLLIAFTSVAIIYAARTYAKGKLYAIDIAKLVWVVSAAASSVFTLFHWAYKDTLNWLNALAFLAMFILYIATPTDKRKRPDVKEERTLDQVQ